MYESPYWTGWAADTWGVSWGYNVEVYAPPAPFASGHNAPPVAQQRKRRGINRRRDKIDADRRIARRQADEDVLLIL